VKSDKSERRRDPAGMSADAPAIELSLVWPGLNCMKCSIEVRDLSLV